MDGAISRPYIGRTAYQKLSIFCGVKRATQTATSTYSKPSMQIKQGRLNFALSEYSRAREVAGSKEICIESWGSEASGEKLEHEPTDYDRIDENMIYEYECLPKSYHYSLHYPVTYTKQISICLLNHRTAPGLTAHSISRIGQTKISRMQNHI